MDEGRALEGILLPERILEVDGQEKVSYFLQLYPYQQTAHAPVNGLPPMLMQAALNSELHVCELHIKAGRELVGEKKNFSKRLGD